TFATTDEDGNNDGKDYGRNATVSINGTSAETDGLTVRLRNSNLDVEFDISTGLNGGNSKTFAITGGVSLGLDANGVL
ncbi:MAG: hypothetical protein NTY75_04520, partial [Candidatus Shapirobacteria bacterium]|nr:hypothetical protein [Candidatus Shapirobacteria bacterium]